MKLVKGFRLFGDLVLLFGTITCLVIIVDLISNHSDVASFAIVEDLSVNKTEELPVIKIDDLNSSYALLVESESNQTLLDYRGSESIYPASMTKIMTTLVVIEALDDLDRPIYLDPKIFYDLQNQNAAMAGFVSGAQVPAIDLLYGMMLSSGAESTLALVNSVSESEAAFVELMNQKADELELTQTHFTNSIGFHNQNHYTTAADMIKLVKHGLQNEIFSQVFTTPVYTTDDMILESSMFRNLTRTAVKNGEITGGKTGFNLEAGRCLVSLATINGKDYILVTAGAENTTENQIQHLLDALYIYDQL